MSCVEEMVARLLTEQRVGMAAAGRLVGPTTHATTVTRWCLRGVRLPDGRVLKLEHFRCGGKIVTTAEALARFLVAQTEVAGSTTPSTVRTPAQRQRATDKALAELDGLGV